MISRFAFIILVLVVGVVVVVVVVVAVAIGEVVVAAIGEVVVVVAALGVRDVKCEVTCGSTGHHGIEDRRWAWVDPFSSAPWVHDPPVGYLVLREGCTVSDFSGLFAPIPLDRDRVGPPHGDVDAGQSRWADVVVVVGIVDSILILFFY